MQKKPLKDALEQYRQENKAWFHTPSHKGRAPMLSLPQEALQFDVTELPQTGSLFDGTGPFAEAEHLAAHFFGTEGTFFSAGGCTLCIQAMLQLTAGKSGKVVCGRLLHRSAVHTMALLGLEPVWIWNRVDAGGGLPGRISPEDVREALRKEPDACAVYITSPDYYGVLSDIAGISRAAEEFGVPVIVDNAHGSHLWFVGEHLHPLEQGAAMSADSAHKTFPVLTGGAWLQVGRREYIPYVKNAMSLFGSTSPSYLTMLSLDECRAWLEQEGRQAYGSLAERAAEMKASFVDMGYGIPLGICDPIRLTLRTADRGISGTQAADFLRRNGIELEYADEEWIVLIPSPMNEEKDFVRLQKALAKMPQGFSKVRQEQISCIPKQEMPLRTAVLSASEMVPVEKSCGRVSAETACPCPPGVPVVMPGEKIDRSMVQFLLNYGISEIKVVK